MGDKYLPLSCLGRFISLQACGNPWFTFSGSFSDFSTFLFAFSSEWSKLSPPKLTRRFSGFLRAPTRFCWEQFEKFVSSTKASCSMLVNDRHLIRSTARTVVTGFSLPERELALSRSATRLSDRIRCVCLLTTLAVLRWNLFVYISFCITEGHVLENSLRG